MKYACRPPRNAVRRSPQQPTAPLKTPRRWTNAKRFPNRDRSLHRRSMSPAGRPSPCPWRRPARPPPKAAPSPRLGGLRGSGGSKAFFRRDEEWFRPAPRAPRSAGRPRDPRAPSVCRAWPGPAMCSQAESALPTQRGAARTRANHNAMGPKTGPTTSSRPPTRPLRRPARPPRARAARRPRPCRGRAHRGHLWRRPKFHVGPTPLHPRCTLPRPRGRSRACPCSGLRTIPSSKRQTSG
mmetsp:Transcript_12432/g.43892  ORF Transcript_12432/g.43892 Transcript_12432/m.43892 type:complete len:239 (+) Transcript_12432:3-719(+)